MRKSSVHWSFPGTGEGTPIVWNHRLIERDGEQKDSAELPGPAYGVWPDIFPTCSRKASIRKSLESSYKNISIAFLWSPKLFPSVHHESPLLQFVPATSDRL